MAQYRTTLMGVDVGSSEICVLIAGHDPDTEEFNLLGMGLAAGAGLRRGLVVDIDALSQAVGQAIDIAVDEAQVHPEHVYASICGEHIVSLNSTGVIGITKRNVAGSAGVGEITADHLNQVLEAAKAMKLPEGREIIHSIPQQFAVDEESGILNPVGMTARRLEAQVHLITGSQSAMRNLVHAFNWSGTKVQQFLFSALAASEAVLSPEEKKMGVALLDIGRDAASSLVYSEYGIQFSNVLSVSAGTVTSDIAQLLRITGEQAEELKLKYGSGWTPETAEDKLFEVVGVGGRSDINISEKQLSEYIEARMDEILRLVRERMYKAGVLKQLHSGIVLTGGGARLRGLLPLAEKVFEVPVRIGTPRGLVDPRNRLQDSAYCTAAGLLLFALRHDMPGNGWNKNAIKGWFKRISGFVKDNF